VEQEASQELLNGKRHQALFVFVRRIPPAKRDLAIDQGDEPVIGDGDAMSVGAEIAQHMFRPSEGFLGIDDPVVAEQDPQPGSKGAWLSKGQKAAVELERARKKSAAESGDELAAEDAAEYLDGKKEGSA